MIDNFVKAQGFRWQYNMRHKIIFLCFILQFKLHLIRLDLEPNTVS